MLKKFFKWIFKDELIRLNTKIETLGKDLDKELFFYKEICNENTRLIDKHKQEISIFKKFFDESTIDVSVDVNLFSPSWAVISIQGKKDFIKFIDPSTYSNNDIREISEFLKHFDRKYRKVDAERNTANFLKHELF